MYPEINSTIIYDFILESIDEIKKFYKLQDRPFKKYTSFLYNYYQIKDKDVPNIKHFKKEKDLYLEEKLIKKIHKIHKKYSDNIDDNIETVIKQLVIDDQPSSKYYYFNKSKNKYLKKNKILSI